jgi:hypothetical protein
MLKKEPIVQILSTVEGLSEDEEVQPKVANKFLPSWWKSMPNYLGVESEDFQVKNRPTAKLCPSFAHWFNEGFIIPAWCDMTLRYDKKTDVYSWLAGGTGSIYSIEHHGNDQFLDHARHNFQGRTANFIFALQCPWRIVTKQGWSVYQLPLFFHFNHDWSVLPGIINTDVTHEINQQILYFGENNEEVFIPKGTPLVQYIPFQRERVNFSFRDATKKDFRTLKSSWLKLRSYHKNGYLRMRKG